MPHPGSSNSDRSGCALIGRRVVMLHSFVEKSDGSLLDPLPKARQEAGLTQAQAQAQAQVAEHRGTQTPAVARLERALAKGRHSPSPATLHKVARACGRQWVLQLA